MKVDTRPTSIIQQIAVTRTQFSIFTTGVPISFFFNHIDWRNLIIRFFVNFPLCVIRQFDAGSSFFLHVFVSKIGVVLFTVFFFFFWQLQYILFMDHHPKIFSYLLTPGVGRDSLDLFWCFLLFICCNFFFI